MHAYEGLYLLSFIEFILAMFRLGDFGGEGRGGEDLYSLINKELRIISPPFPSLSLQNLPSKHLGIHMYEKVLNFHLQHLTALQKN